MKISLLFALSLIFQLAHSQTIDSAFGYVPLETGNTWEYDYRSIFSNSHLYFYTETITGDTVAPNGLKYFIIVKKNLSYKTSSIALKRIDSATANFYRYGGTLPDSEFLEDSLRSKPGDRFGITTCTSLQTQTILGLTTSVKSFSYSVIGRHDLAYGLGRVYEWSEISGLDYSSTLLYARVGNKEYGTPAFVRTQGSGPINFSLSQNYPNPFNSSTIIRFHVAKREFVTLEVRNILSQTVSILVSEILPSGNYEKVFDAENFPSGIYYYTLRNQISSLTKTMILLK